MKSIKITFRLTPYQLARGLQTIRQLEPTYQLTSTNDIVKTIYHDCLAKMPLNKSADMPTDLIEEIQAFLTKPKLDKQITLDELIQVQDQKH